ncbi:hypothetical protein P171DRAFT_198444 [Karstenula rhodostoma CBS 690.94]|uniref:Uncharacterized protein n=1 Tax=Karstenula rhodostoma CBS 690.94 TaxID=1392251 RepID=A0A9P4PQZ5_9PLEO|nr:hypothetical protein P171DRAFT_198444 [Karstenula rhodostoma CBS 690.94]
MNCAISLQLKTFRYCLRHPRRGVQIVFSALPGAHLGSLSLFCYFACQTSLTLKSEISLQSEQCNLWCCSYSFHTNRSAKLSNPHSMERGIYQAVRPNCTATHVENHVAQAALPRHTRAD